MEEYELQHEYFEWMCQLVTDKQYSIPYDKLFSKLHDTEFIYILPLDGNRYEDGIDLRYRFGRENGYSDPLIANMLDIRPCSVLEMLIALSLRCEEQIMANPDIGNRTGEWFWKMIFNLGLGTMDDRYFDEEAADYILNRFLNREYDSDGTGGLFIIHNPLYSQYDMRRVEIWYQMCWYLNDVVN